MNTVMECLLILLSIILLVSLEKSRSEVSKHRFCRGLQGSKNKDKTQNKKPGQGAIKYIKKITV